MLRAVARIPRGRVLVVGCGFAGLLFTQALVRRGDEVVAADPVPHRLDLALGYGAAPANGCCNAWTSCRCRPGAPSLEHRGEDPAVIDEVQSVDTELRALAAKRDGLRAEIRVLSNEVGKLFREQRKDDVVAPYRQRFTRREGVIRHFWGAELGFESADPGKDPTTEPDLMMLWNVLDLTPGGRGADWYPSITY